jgi:hypothetical protein
MEGCTYPNGRKYSASSEFLAASKPPILKNLHEKNDSCSAAVCHEKTAQNPTL